MAIQGELITHEEIKQWYTIFNNIAQQYSNGITSLAIPAQYDKIYTSDVNNLHNQINKFREDTYLSTQLSWFPTGENVTVGEYIKPEHISAIQTVLENSSKIKCRNIATNSSGTNSCGEKAHGANSSTCSSGKNTYSTYSHGTNSCGVHREDGNAKVYNSHTTKGHGDRSHGTKGHGTKSCGTFTCGLHTHTEKAHTTTIDITCVHTTKTNSI